MRHKVANLEGSLLDAAVAKAEGLQWAPHPRGCAVMRDFIGIGGGAYELWSPSEEWEIGGPIIQREGIDLAKLGNGLWRAYEPDEPFDGRCGWEPNLESQTGPTPLIAAMRAYVSSRFGDEVELP